MSENTFDDAARALESRDVLRGSFELRGETFPLELREPTLGELDEIERELSDDAEEIELYRELIDRYLETPEVDPDDMGVGKLEALFTGMRRAWEESDVIDEATEQMPLEGNRRQRSRR